MLIEFINGLGGWSWFILGLVLLIGEVLIPGTMLVWFGLSAVAVGTITVTPFLGLAWWTWQAQIVAFGVLSVAFVTIGQRFMAKREMVDDDASRMNRPLLRLMGREAVLVEPIEHGFGRIKLGDTTWRVRGPAMPAGTRVHVVGEEDDTLLVEAT